MGKVTNIEKRRYQKGFFIHHNGGKFERKQWESPTFQRKWAHRVEKDTRGKVISPESIFDRVKIPPMILSGGF